MVDAMHQTPRKPDVRVVQILGGVGNPAAEIHAARLTSRFARLVNGTATFLPGPGVVGSERSLHVLLEDQYVKEALDLFTDVTSALVGIGAVEPSKLLVDSGNIFSLEQLYALSRDGAVGDIVLRFFDANGQHVQNNVDNRVISMTLRQLQQVNRSVGVAGGRRKFKAILGALRGGFINVLITDCFTARRLVVSKH